MTPSPILILGIGNLLWADEGFGVRAVEAINARWRFPDHVQLLDGGTLGLNLVHYVQEAEKVLVFDAIDYGLPPGTMKVILNEEVPLYLGAKKMSLHQTGFQEVLACAKLTDQYPKELVLVGVQPKELDDFGGSLRDEVKSQIEPALEVALEWLARWGVIPEAQEEALPLGPSELGMAAFEAVRG